ncbi:DNA-directed RNA polymerase subunit delta [Salipaludibacillus aurantiacus]|uniref:Probable DNA-directed RNA polymerase subunit delta n=1 Tax=Salipaludibacillus aurantiacus TaxID=1601833 RepID=A0A1H9VBG6_9BACI|nr:DNA-directed RNA polymerase subunit delta [Salipaludibacillus aurantiacus]SES19160.1 DNA-directed RNA polymerase subunit delta [Salipaludibacillus aurantiacus]
MSLKDFTEEQLQETSMIEIANELLTEQNNPIEYHSLLKQVGEAKGLSDEQLTNRISHLYTEMSMDGRFVNLGDNRWGLRSWYPFDQTEEDLSQEATKARKKRAKEKEEEEGFYDDLSEDFDEFEDLEDELDDLANEEDTDFDEVEDDDFTDTNDDNETSDEETEEDER